MVNIRSPTLRTGHMHLRFRHTRLRESGLSFLCLQLAHWLQFTVLWQPTHWPQGIHWEGGEKRLKASLMNMFAHSSSLKSTTSFILVWFGTFKPDLACASPGCAGHCGGFDHTSNEFYTEVIPETTTAAPCLPLVSGSMTTFWIWEPKSYKSHNQLKSDMSRTQQRVTIRGGSHGKTAVALFSFSVYICIFFLKDAAWKLSWL